MTDGMQSQVSRNLKMQVMSAWRSKQHSSVLHSPTKWLKECILSGRYWYEENLMLEINFRMPDVLKIRMKNKYDKQKEIR